MKKEVLTKEITAEVCNAAALGAYNALLSNEDIKPGQKMPVKVKNDVTFINVLESIKGEKDVMDFANKMDPDNYQLQKAVRGYSVANFHQGTWKEREGLTKEERQKHVGGFQELKDKYLLEVRRQLKLKQVKGYKKSR